MRISGVTYVPGKTRKIKGTVAAILIIFIISALAIIIYSSVVGWNIIHPQRTGIGAISSNIAPEFKDMTFKNANKDITLSGWYFESKGSKSTVILAHGYGSNRLPFKEKTYDLIKSFKNKGYNLLTFDFRNSGNSGGDKTTLGYYEKDDLLSAIARVKASGAKTIILLGLSSGASASILAGAESADVSAVIADSSFSDLNKFLVTENSIGPVHLPPFPINRLLPFSISLLAGIDTNSVNPAGALKKLAPRPLLLIHGKNDSMISCKNSEELYREYSKIEAKAEIWEVDGAGHLQAFTKSPAEYMDRVIRFLDDNLK